MPIISYVSHLPAMLDRHPDKPIVFFNRVSSYGQARRRNKLLHIKTAADEREVEAMAPGRIIKTFIAVEEGYLHKPRKGLRAAGQYAKDHGAILVAIDLSRFIRPPSYSRTKNWQRAGQVRPISLLHEMTHRVPLATVLSL